MSETHVSPSPELARFAAARLRLQDRDCRRRQDFATAQPDLPDRVAIYLNDRRSPLSAFTADMLQDAKTSRPAFRLPYQSSRAGLVEGITLTLFAIGSDGTEHRMTNAFIVAPTHGPKKDRRRRGRYRLSIGPARWPLKSKARPGCTRGVKEQERHGCRPGRCWPNCPIRSPALRRCPERSPRRKPGTLSEPRHSAGPETQSGRSRPKEGS